MDIQLSIEIDQPLDAVWNLLAERFGDAHVWRSDVHHSYPEGKAKLLHLNHGGRVLETDKGMVHETLTSLDANQRSFSYRRADGVPFYVRKVSDIWSLTKAVDGATLVVVNQTISAQPPFGLFLLMARNRHAKQLRKQLTDLKTALEHPKR